MCVKVKSDISPDFFSFKFEPDSHTIMCKSLSNMTYQHVRLKFSSSWFERKQSSQVLALFFKFFFFLTQKENEKRKVKACGSKAGLTFCCALQIALFVMCLIWKSSSTVFSLS